MTATLLNCVHLVSSISYSKAHLLSWRMTNCVPFSTRTSCLLLLKGLLSPVSDVMERLSRQTKRGGPAATQWIAPTGLRRHTPWQILSFYFDPISFLFRFFSSVCFFWFFSQTHLREVAVPRNLKLSMFSCSSVLFTNFSFFSFLLSKGLFLFSKYLTWKSSDVFHQNDLSCLVLSSVSKVKSKRIGSTWSVSWWR